MPDQPPELMGTAEVAAHLGVSRQRVLQLLAQEHSGFPQPVAVLSMGKVWDGRQVREWSRRHQRPRRP